MVSVRDSHFDSSYEFTSDEGMMLAFGLTAYDDNQEPIEDAQYGTLQAYYKSWGLIDNLDDITFTMLPTKQCTRR